MQKAGLLILVSIVFIGIFGFAYHPNNEDAVLQLLSKANLFNLRFPQERVYLHLDRPSYWAGDDIW